MPDVGAAAPSLSLPGIQNGERRDFSLSGYRGSPVVVAFYPGDFTFG